LRRADAGSGSVRGMNVPDELRYSSDHEWVRLEDGKVRIGITAPREVEVFRKEVKDSRSETAEDEKA
jgi:glycine cleavage system H lipoate-binding protein